MDTVKQILLQLLGGFVNAPEGIEINTSEDEDENGKITVLTVKVDNSDVGICIGKKGETAEAMRKIIALVGFKNAGHRVYLKIDAPKAPRTYFSSGSN